MASKNYSKEFRCQAVDLYESTPGATLKGIAADLGVARGTLAGWVDKLGRSSKTGAGSLSSARNPRSPAQSAGPARDGSPAEKIARLEAELASARAQNTKLATERDILRSAAKYFAGETRW